MLKMLLAFDSQITQILYSFIPHNYFLNYFFSFFSLRGISSLIWVSLMILVLMLEERKNPGISKKDRQFIILFLVAFLSTVLIVEFTLKNLFQRPRPTIDFNRFQLIVTDYNCPKDFSFPSGHAATAFAAATILASFDRKRKIFYYLIATLIAFSRIYLGCHFFFDIFAGAIIGYLISKSILIRLKKLK